MADQKYCCDTFGKAVESKHGGINRTDLGKSLAWISSVGWFQTYYFSCGRPTIPPIQS